MCGIFLAISRRDHVELPPQVYGTLKSRGPDSLVVFHAIVGDDTSTPRTTNHESTNNRFYLTFASSVLSLRGAELTTQPLVDASTGSVLCWNGEAWKIDDSQIDGNDSQVIFKSLLRATSKVASDAKGQTGRSDYIAEVLTKVAGPYAFVFYDAQTATVYYGRDRFGRRSLLDNVQHKDFIESSSTAIISSFETDSDSPAIEVDTSGVHVMSLRDAYLKPRLTPWPAANSKLNRTQPHDQEVTSCLSSNVTVDTLCDSLTKSLRLRVLDVPTYNATDHPSSDPSRVAVLFSGGLDCTLLARICHDILPIDQSIDLLNVAFENPRTIRAAASTAKKSPDHIPLSPYETCPDRLTGRSSFSELLETCPRRTWRFLAINVPYTDTLSQRPAIIRLMRPHNTEMDLSIAMALYFAARGQGYATTTSDVMQEPLTYTTTARVLLSGLGADELFGGYTRHATAFSRGGWTALNDELELDFTRIGSRNLGRDDRVMAHWAKEVRYPFLDEDFVKYTLSLPAWEKCGFRVGNKIPKHFDEVPKGTVTREEDLDPAKMLLRRLAWKLGMKRVAAEKKRAIQFGARTAKMEGGRSKGTDILSVA